MKFKVVFHVNSDSDGPFQMACVNITNMLKDSEVLENGAEIVMLLNGPGILKLKNGSNLTDLDTVNELGKKGVKFQICNNSLIKFNLAKDDMHPLCEVVPAGVMALIKLQASGYAYIKP